LHRTAEMVRQMAITKPSMRLAVVDTVLAHSLRLAVTVTPNRGVARNPYNRLGKGYLKAATAGRGAPGALIRGGRWV
jgi:hypothetical protein